jgi:type 1 glutamine amidotransferase
VNPFPLLFVLHVLVTLLAACAQESGPRLKPVPIEYRSESAMPRILVYSHTAEYRHQSIPDGIHMIQELGDAHDFDVDHSEDPALFETRDLSQYKAIVWLSTSGDALSDEGKAAFEAYMKAGGGYVGIHAAADTEYGWPFYGGLLGCNAWFQNHPKIQEARLEVDDREHPSTKHLGAEWALTDEWYNYKANPAPCVTVLMRLDETSYENPEHAMGANHPIAWHHAYGGGRAWYTGLGHRAELYAMPEYQQHVLGGILWAAGLE